MASPAVGRQRLLGLQRQVGESKPEHEGKNAYQQRLLRFGSARLAQEQETEKGKHHRIAHASSEGDGQPLGDGIVRQPKTVKLESNSREIALDGDNQYRARG